MERPVYPERPITHVAIAPRGVSAMLDSTIVVIDARGRVWSKTSGNAWVELDTVDHNGIL